MITEEKLQSVALTALVVGYNEFAKQADTLGTRLWYRLMANRANVEAKAIGGGVTYTNENPRIGEVEVFGATVELRESDYELMRSLLEKHDDEMLARVCPGCHAVAPERCAPGCIDAEIAREREDDLTHGNHDSVEDDSDEDDEPTGDW